METKVKRLYLVRVGKEGWAASWQTSLSAYKGYLNQNFKEPKINWGTLLIGKSAEEKSLELKINLNTDVK